MIIRRGSFAYLLSREEASGDLVLEVWVNGWLFTVYGSGDVAVSTPAWVEVERWWKIPLAVLTRINAKGRQRNART